jgi:outer membrane protein assembly factor BamB
MSNVDYNTAMSTVLDSTTVPGVRLLYRLAVLLAAVSGAFCIFFCVQLAVHYHGLLSFDNVAVDAETDTVLSNDPSYRVPADDSFNRLPTDYQSFLALRQALAQNRQDESLKAQIRELDHKLRVDYFNRRQVLQYTTHFLLLSSILFFAAVRTASTLKREIPSPHVPSPHEGSQRRERKDTWGFAAVTAWLMLCVGLYVGLMFAPPLQLEQVFMDKLSHLSGAPTQMGAPVSTQSDGTAQTQTAPLPAIELTEELLAKNWVSFRNFDGNGVGFSDKPPVEWDGKTGKNVIWQTEVPLPGNSSPVIWENRLFLSGADENTQKIFGYNIENGELLWTTDVTQPGLKTPEVDGDTGFAAPTPVVDGRHVYAIFANGELVAVDLNGKFIWRKSFGLPSNHYGYASSLALFFDRLIVQFDDEKEGNSKIVALDLSTGDVIWETAREDNQSSWASPTIKKIGDSYQIIVCGDPYAIAYNPENGEEIWRCRCLSGGDVGPSAVALGNVVLITNTNSRTTAIDATGAGDVTATHELWRGVNATPDTVSPLATEEYFLTLSSGGYLTGYDPKVINPQNRRARYWELEVGDMASFYSSPLRVGTYIYAFDKSVEGKAKAFVIDLSKVAIDDKGMLTEESEAAMIIAENPMPEPCVASPAILNNRLYIRGETKIYCIGEK